MEIYPLPESDLRFAEQTRTDAECAKLLHEFEQFSKTDLCAALANDSLVELKLTILSLIEEDDLSNEKLHTLRGECRALYRTWKRQEEMIALLLEETNNKQNNGN
jgi:hypothetical protein